MLSVIAECFVWCSLVFLSITGRYISQWLSHQENRGWRKFRADDYVMIFSTLFYAGFIITMVWYEELNLGIDQDDYTNPIYASIETKTYTLMLVAESTIQGSLWCNKICMLLVYQTFTRLPWKSPLIIFSYVLIFITWAVHMTLLYTLCTPFSQYFNNDSTDENCRTWMRYGISQLICNVGTDIYLMVLFWILFLNLNVPPVKKILLLALFNLGIFVITTAIITKYVEFTSGSLPLPWAAWALRETSTAMLVANLSMCFPLMLSVYRQCRIIVSTNFFPSCISERPKELREPTAPQDDEPKGVRGSSDV